MTFEEWKAQVTQEWAPKEVEFILEDGTGLTYGESGDHSGYIGPDRQAHFVGCYIVEDDFCNIHLKDGSVQEGDCHEHT